MNERIQELAEQAEKLTDDETNAFTDATGQWQAMWNEVYDRKFAELIVRECIEVLRMVPYDCDGPEFGNEVVYQEAVKKHFGVEE